MTDILSLHLDRQELRDLERLAFIFGHDSASDLVREMVGALIADRLGTPLERIMGWAAPPETFSDITDTGGTLH